MDERRYELVTLGGCRQPALELLRRWPTAGAARASRLGGRAADAARSDPTPRRSRPSSPPRCGSPAEVVEDATSVSARTSPSCGSSACPMRRSSTSRPRAAARCFVGETLDALGVQPEVGVRDAVAGAASGAGHGPAVADRTSVEASPTCSFVPSVGRSSSTTPAALNARTTADARARRLSRGTRRLVGAGVAALVDTFLDWRASTSARLGRPERVERLRGVIMGLACSSAPGRRRVSTRSCASARKARSCSVSALLVVVVALRTSRRRRLAPRSGARRRRLAAGVAAEPAPRPGDDGASRTSSDRQTRVDLTRGAPATTGRPPTPRTCRAQRRRPRGAPDSARSST